MNSNATRKIHHSSKVPLTRVADATTTPAADTNPKPIEIDLQATRRAQNEEFLQEANVKAFLDTLAETEGGDYDLRYGGIKGKKNDRWRITDYSRPPEVGIDGKTTASGRYQINFANWQENGKKRMGLNDFSPHTQDLIAVEGLRRAKAIDAILEGHMPTAIGKASKTWNSLPQGPGAANRVTGQHYVPYDDVIEIFRRNGGTVAKE